jgi:hypothetical protein
MNPVLKRFLKGLIAALIAATLLYVAKILPGLNLFNASITAMIVGLILAIEKAIPQNL